MADIRIYPHHAGISVADLDASIAWYRDKLGFELIDQVYLAHIRCKIAMLRNGDFELELFRCDEPRPLPPERRHPDTDVPILGFKHFCLGTDQFDALVDRLRAQGVTFLVEPGQMPRSRFCYIADLDGNPIELMQPF